MFCTFDIFSKYRYSYSSYIRKCFIHEYHLNEIVKCACMLFLYYLKYRHLLIAISMQTTMSCSILYVCCTPIAIQHTVSALSRCTLTVDLMVYNFVLAIYHEYLNQNVMDKLHFHCQVEIYINHSF